MQLECQKYFCRGSRNFFCWNIGFSCQWVSLATFIHVVIFAVLNVVHNHRIAFARTRQASFLIAFSGKSLASNTFPDQHLQQWIKRNSSLNCFLKFYLHRGAIIFKEHCLKPFPITLQFLFVVGDIQALERVTKEETETSVLQPKCYNVENGVVCMCTPPYVYNVVTKKCEEFKGRKSITNRYKYIISPKQLNLFILFITILLVRVRDQYDLLISDTLYFIINRFLVNIPISNLQFLVLLGSTKWEYSPEMG